MDIVSDLGYTLISIQLKSIGTIFPANDWKSLLVISRLQNELDISKSSFSLHLKELRHARLVQSIKNSRKVDLQVNPDKLEELKEFFKISIDQQTEEWVEGTK